MESKCISGNSPKYTSVRRHGGGGFGGHDIEKEVSIDYCLKNRKNDKHRKLHIYVLYI